MIDRSVEPWVREILGSVVVQDGNRLDRALKAVPDSHAQSALNLALAIDRTVMSDLHEGQPSEERLNYLTDGFIEMEDWYKTDGLPIKNFLRWLAGMPADPLDEGVLGLLAFLVGGWLLSGFLDSGAHWYEYLDGILDRLDAEPGAATGDIDN